MALSLVLGAAVGLSLAIIAFALTPAWAMRRSRAVLLRGRRDTLLWAGLTAALAIALGAGIALWLS
jgi:hypothetical protein